MAIKKDDVEKIKEAVSGKDESKKDVKKEPELTDLPGIGPAVAAKLDGAGVFDMMSLAVMSPAVLSDTAGVSAVARKAIQAARDMLELGFTDGVEFSKKRENISYITTGSKEMDNLLGGRGVETKAITEAFGAYGSGKSQLGFTLAVNTQLPVEKGGANGKTVFIDTEGTFRPARIKQISEGLGANPEKVLKNILVARAFNSDHQILLLEKIGEMVKKGEPIKLVVVDSLTAHFRAEFSGRGQLADRQQKLNRYLHDLMKLAETHNLAIYVTNQVMANPAQMFGDPTTAIGGNIVGHACFTGDTKVALADGRDLSFVELINEHKQGKENFTFTIDKNKKIKIAQIKNPRKTGYGEIMKVILDNGEEIKCTLNHKFMLRGGNYKEAQHLKPRDSLMPLYFKETQQLPVPIAPLENANHKVIRTEFLREFSYVYDLTIEDTHNFALASGIFVHNSTFRMYLRRGKKGSRVAKLIDSPNLPDNECVFWVSEGGVGDEA
jgi:DNA repair protein RadA